MTRHRNATPHAAARGVAGMRASRCGVPVSVGKANTTHLLARTAVG